MPVSEVVLSPADYVVLGAKPVKRKVFQSLIGKLLRFLGKAITGCYGTLPRFAFAMAKITAGVMLPVLAKKYSPIIREKAEKKFRAQTIKRIEKILGVLRGILSVLGKVLSIVFSFSGLM